MTVIYLYKLGQAISSNRLALHHATQSAAKTITLIFILYYFLTLTFTQILDVNSERTLRVNKATDDRVPMVPGHLSTESQTPKVHLHS